MLLIPVSYVIAAYLLILLIKEVKDKDKSSRNMSFVVFLGVVSLQLVLIGTRYGYQVESIRTVQPCLAAIIPGLAYFSFTEKPNRLPGLQQLLLHLLPILLVFLEAIFARELLDITVAAIFLVYALLLTYWALFRSNNLEWIEFNAQRNYQIGLWTVIVTFYISATTDFLIVITRWNNLQWETGSIVGLSATLSAAVLWATTLYFNSQRMSVSAFVPQRMNTDAAREITVNVIGLMKSANVQRDPSCSVDKIAKKLGITSRSISIAINQSENINVSTFVNNYRINEVCDKLKNTDLSITEIMYSCGFNTKSNFNREFKRVTGQSPSQWRKNIRPQNKP